MALVKRDRILTDDNTDAEEEASYALHMHFPVFIHNSRHMLISFFRGSNQQVVWFQETQELTYRM
jgi:hypothetical protein